MATTEGKSCHDDSDCSKKQYCYHVAKLCVDYTQCIRYNREENAEKGARDPSQCGPCLPGYTADELVTGEMAMLCKKTNNQENTFEEDGQGNNTLVYVMVVVLVFVLAACILIYLFCRRRSPKRQGKMKLGQELLAVEPTAPPLENSTLISYKETSPVSSNNNQNLKDKNRLARASGYVPPRWIRPNPNYNDSGNENLNVMDQMNAVSNTSAGDNSNWAPEQLAIEVTDGDVIGYAREQIDNTLNTVLVQANNPPSFNAAQGNNSNNNDDNNNASSSGSDSAQGSRERGRTSNILISQKISMNVNLINGDS
ncbi:uncharacterized protein DDB_G0292186-like [Ceratina calcarata]|uniref:Uncharacterized protein DDB_G0292186-like n=1 Tax=Ceratina calcarata TaxID=156304 RepID=A0AAJ7JAF8_9HYME|nr:uncharacterized protein DDB_G0292186-like [Ceratina calcarata]XP_026673274.1 uncharacterized protein DDB_G0292186-like [Ceratina calcarata]